MMKVFEFSVLFLVLGTAFLLLATTTVSSPGMISSVSGKNDIVTSHNRKLMQEKVYSSNKRKDDGNINLEDYRPVDPSPNSRAAITTGPIEHSTPLMPFIPKPAPPTPGGPIP